MIEINSDFKTKIKNIIEQQEFFLYYIEQKLLNHQLHVIVYINKENYDSSISLDDCVLITAEIKEVVDSYFACEYVLEVSSSGINRQLYELRHYQEVCGQKIKVHFKNQVAGFVAKKVTALLTAVDETGITIQQQKVNFTKIKKAYYAGGKDD